MVVTHGDERYPFHFLPFFLDICGKTRFNHAYYSTEIAKKALLRLNSKKTRPEGRVKGLFLYCATATPASLSV